MTPPHSNTADAAAFRAAAFALSAGIHQSNVWGFSRLHLILIVPFDVVCKPFQPWYECCDSFGKVIFNYLTHISVKTILSTIALTLALGFAVGATAQNKSTVSRPAADTVMLSETADGDYLVRRYVVNSDKIDGYSIRYLINSARLMPSLNGNPGEIRDLNAFVESLASDSMLRVRSIEIVGYASPDGPRAFNEQLAKRRAQDFRNYVDKKYDLSKRYDVSVKGVAENWNAAVAPVRSSSIQDRQAVLDILGSRDSDQQKELRLKRMTPAVWNYMRETILPPLRRVEMTVHYAQSRYAEQRMLIVPVVEEREVVVEEVCNPCCDVVIDESINGLIVEMDDVGVDW